MEALVFHGAGQTAWQGLPDPGIKDAADAIVRVDDVTICGIDLHVVKGDVPEGTPGRILGHEAVGTAVETGGDVPTVRPGDRVLVSCISACGRCRFCRESHYGQCCGSSGRVLGHTIAGAARAGDTGALKVALGGARHDAVTVPATRP
ncbi:alcohol dehydrogenase catalytic domain-containing protein [Streptomyces sp. NPDC001549]|uniref:alcohol dehydrogenase catalytic domain-containing protein n=1 Tax=Streptomyces sp. NPDC001549 TaxID=3364586 RepID=UPI003694A43F